MSLRQYPKISYTLNNKEQVVTDITKRMENTESEKNDYYYERHILEEFMRPDHMSHLLYENVDYDWIILLANKIKNPSLDWTVSNSSLYEYVDKKYPDEMIQLDNNYFSQQQNYTSVEQYYSVYENKLKITKFKKKIDRFKNHVIEYSTLDSISEENRTIVLNFIIAIDELNIFLNFMDDTWPSYLSNFQINLLSVFETNTNSNIDYFKREFLSFYNTLTSDIALYGDTVRPSLFFINGEKIMGKSSGAIAKVKSFDYNSTQLFIKERSGGFTEGEIVYGENSAASFIFKSENLKREYLGNYTRKSANSILNLNFYDVEYDLVSHLLFDANEEAYTDSGSRLKILNVVGSTKLKFEILSGVPSVGETITSVDSNAVGKIESINYGTRYIDVVAIDLSSNQSFVASSVVPGSSIPTESELSSFDELAYGSSTQDGSILEIYNFSNISFPCLIKIENSFAILNSIKLKKTVPSQSSLLSIDNKTYIEYENDNNFKKRDIIYLKPEHIAIYLEQYNNILSGI